MQQCNKMQLHFKLCFFTWLVSCQLGRCPLSRFNLNLTPFSRTPLFDSFRNKPTQIITLICLSTLFVWGKGFKQTLFKKCKIQLPTENESTLSQGAYPSIYYDESYDSWCYVIPETTIWIKVPRPLRELRIITRKGTGVTCRVKVK